MPCDFFIFPKLKVAFKERSFNDITMFQAKLQDAFAVFQTVPFIECFEQFCICWACCVKFQGKYFEHDSLDLKVSVVEKFNAETIWSHHLCALISALQFSRMLMAIC
jgi:hypothetical protein